MSGHSKWSTIKRQKATTDQARGKLFSKLSRAISVAVKEGGSDNPDFNAKLRMAVEQAKTANMPKVNIERAIQKASESGDLEEIIYEGFAQEGVGVVVEVTTDNRNRTSQEIKNIFERSGGSMGGPGSVMFNFEKKGELEVQTGDDIESQMLEIIDLGADDVLEVSKALIVYTDPAKLQETKEGIEELGYKVLSYNMSLLPKNKIKLVEEDKIKKVTDLLEKLSEHDDVQQVYSALEN